MSDKIIIDGVDKKIKDVRVRDRVYNDVSFIYRKWDGCLFEQLEK